MTKNLFYLLLLTIILQGCGAIQDTPRKTFTDGIYTGAVFHNKRERVYVERKEDTVVIHPLLAGPRPSVVDTANRSRVVLYHKRPDAPPRTTYQLRRTSFDVDLMTIPFKLRPAAAGVPAQFNTNLNGVVFVGYRSDLYRIHHQHTPLGRYRMEIAHYAFSVGCFSGLGGTAVHATVLGSNTDREYDGVVWMKGIAGILGINNLTVGLALGWDTLLDQDGSDWIYRNKPWLGLAFGLNLN